VKTILSLRYWLKDSVVDHSYSHYPIYSFSLSIPLPPSTSLSFFLSYIPLYLSLSLSLSLSPPPPTSIPPFLSYTPLFLSISLSPSLLQVSTKLMVTYLRDGRVTSARGSDSSLAHAQERKDLPLNKGTYVLMCSLCVWTVCVFSMYVQCVWTVCMYGVYRQYVYGQYVCSVCMYSVNVRCV
jgi:hypothetical protein